jgi:tetratricopeptide (TPR) repeat protein
MWGLGSVVVGARFLVVEEHRAGTPQSISVRLHTRAGQSLAAAAVVISAAVGLMTNLVTDQRGWGLGAGAAALVVLVVCGAMLAWFLQGSQEDQARTSPVAQDQVHLALGSVAPPWGLLPDRVRGRDKLIEQLGGLTATPDGRVHLLSGLGGSGKTTVALTVCSLARASGQAWWISARDRSSVESGLLDLAGALGVTSVELEQARGGHRSVLDLVWERLEVATRPWILVIDNADAPELLAAKGSRTRDGNGVARGSVRGLTVVTSRNGDRQVWGDGAVIHPIGLLEADDAADVLLDLSGPQAGTSQQASVLARRLGCLPLALRAAGHYLSSTTAKVDGVGTFEAYREDLDARFAILQGAILPDSSAQDIVMTTWEASLDLLAGRGHPDARPFMRLIGQFAAAPIPVGILDPVILGASGLFSQGRHRIGWRLGSSRPHLGKHELGQVIAALTALGLLDMTDYEPSPWTGVSRPCPPAIPCIVAHPLVVEVNAQALNLDKAMQQAAVTTMVELVAAAAQQADPRSPSDAATWPLLAPHIQVLAASVPKLPTEDMVRFAAAAERTATGLRHGGDYSAALHILTRAREAVGQLAPEHPAVLALRHTYAYVTDDLGRFAEAEAEYRSILDSRIRSLGARDPLTLRTRNHLGFALSRQGRFAEAEAEYRQALQEQIELLGPEDQDTLTTQNNLADVLYALQRYTEAAQHYEKVLQVQLRALGPEHPRTLTTRNSLARYRSIQGQHAEAEKELRAILNLRRDSRGADHPTTLTTQYDLAASLERQERLAEAQREFRAVLDARRRVLGESHPDTMITAEELHRVSWQEAAKTLGHTSKDTLGMDSDNPPTR